MSALSKFEGQQASVSIEIRVDSPLAEPSRAVGAERPLMPLRTSLLSGTRRAALRTSSA